MAPYNILNRFRFFRRGTIPSSTFLSTLSPAREYHLLSTSTIPPSHLLRTPNSFAGLLGFLNSRTISTRSEHDSEFRQIGRFDTESITESNITDATLAITGEDSILPIRVAVSVLDGFHDLTGLPWWVVIASSTLALRLVLFPLLIFQLHKLKRIGELFNKLPPPFPPPFSGKSYIDHYSLFRKERKAIRCPSFLWFLPYVCVQVPCFFLWMTTIRRMSLDHHPGFDCGGAFWFQSLTEFSHGVLGSIFPVVVAGLHYANVQISFRTSTARKATGLLDLLVKYYKHYLDFLTLPILLTCYYVPQGSLVYWVTNSSLTAIQQLSLKNPAVLAKLGLPDKDNLSSAAGSDNSIPVITPSEFEKLKKVSLEDLSPAITPSSEAEKLQKLFLEDLSPKELLNLSVQLLSKGHMQRAIPIIELALSKDPEYTRGLVLMGQTLIQKGLHTEAIEYLERAISKLLLAGHPAEVEDIDHLICASQWAGSLYIRQGILKEGLVHLERIGRLKEPEDPVCKSHYFDGLFLLSSALHNVGRREEAVYYLRLAAAYNPAFNQYLEQCENDDDSLVSDLANSRRHDY